MHELTPTGAGKGSAPRYKHNENWKQNFAAIKWDKGRPKGFVRRGNKQTKKY
jgi:hypothetical protein